MTSRNFLNETDEVESQTDPIKAMLEKASNEIKDFTKENAFLRETSINDEEVAKALFGKDTKAETSYLDFVYSITLEDGKMKRCRSRLAAITYSIGFPVFFKYEIETESPDNMADKTSTLKTEREFFDALVVLLNSKHVKRLLNKAKNLK